MLVEDDDGRGKPPDAGASETSPVITAPGDRIAVGGAGTSDTAPGVTAVCPGRGVSAGADGCVTTVGVTERGDWDTESRLISVAERPRGSVGDTL